MRQQDGYPKPLSIGGTLCKRYILSPRPWWLRWKRIRLQFRRPGFNSWVGKIPWRRAWEPTAVFLPGEFPWIEECLEEITWADGHSPCSRKESDKTERQSTMHNRPCGTTASFTCPKSECANLLVLRGDLFHFTQKDVL